MKTYYFGVREKRKPGHFLFGVGMRWVSPVEEKSVPIGMCALDGPLLTPPETQGRIHLAIINGWTVMGMWDRTGDERFGSCSSFLAEGVHTEEEMERFIAMTRALHGDQWNGRKKLVQSTLA